MTSPDVVKSVSKKLKYYFEIKRLEDGFDLSGPESPRLDHPPMKPRPIMSSEGLHDRPLKHYFPEEDSKVVVTQMKTKKEKGTKEKRIRNMVEKYVSRYQYVPPTLVDAYYVYAPVGIRRPKLIRRQAPTNHGFVPRKRSPYKGGQQNSLRSVPSGHVSRGEAQRLINMASKLLVATDTLDLGNTRGTPSSRRARQRSAKQSAPKPFETEKNLPVIDGTCSESSKSQLSITSRSQGNRRGGNLSPKSTSVDDDSAYDTAGARGNSREQKPREAARTKRRPNDAVPSWLKQSMSEVELGEDDRGQHNQWIRPQSAYATMVPHAPSDDPSDVGNRPSSSLRPRSARPASAHSNSRSGRRDSGSMPPMRLTGRMRTPDGESITIDFRKPKYIAPPIYCGARSNRSRPGAQTAPQQRTEEQNGPPPPPFNMQLKWRAWDSQPSLTETDTSEFDVRPSTRLSDHPDDNADERPPVAARERKTKSAMQTTEMGVQTSGELLKHYDPMDTILWQGDKITYRIYVVTGDRLGAATKADIKLTLVGDRGRTEEAYLRNSLTHKVLFQRGQEDVFEINTVYVGTLRRILIGHDRKELGYGWFLDRVLVKDLEHQLQYDVPCQEWLSSRDGDGTTFRQFSVCSGSTFDPDRDVTPRPEPPAASIDPMNARVKLIEEQLRQNKEQEKPRDDIENHSADNLSQSEDHESSKNSLAGQYNESPTRNRKETKSPSISSTDPPSSSRTSSDVSTPRIVSMDKREPVALYQESEKFVVRQTAITNAPANLHSAPTTQNDVSDVSSDKQSQVHSDFESTTAQYKERDLGFATYKNETDGTEAKSYTNDEVALTPQDLGEPLPAKTLDVTKDLLHVNNSVNIPKTGPETPDLLNVSDMSEPGTPTHNKETADSNMDSTEVAIETVDELEQKAGSMAVSDLAKLIEKLQPFEDDVTDDDDELASNSSRYPSGSRSSSSSDTDGGFQEIVDEWHKKNTSSRRTSETSTTSGSSSSSTTSSSSSSSSRASPTPDRKVTMAAAAPEQPEPQQRRTLLTLPESDDGVDSDSDFFDRTPRARDLAGTTVNQAARQGDLVRVKTLIDKNTTAKNEADERGWNPLHNSAAKGHVELVKYLAAIHADMDALTPTGYSPVHLAAMGGYTKCIVVMAAMGADVHLKSMGEQDTCLHLATKSGHLDTVKWLVSNRANVHELDIMGRTALDLAQEGNNKAIVDYLSDLTGALNKKANELNSQSQPLEQNGAIRATSSHTERTNAKMSDPSTPRVSLDETSSEKVTAKPPEWLSRSPSRAPTRNDDLDDDLDDADELDRFMVSKKHDTELMEKRKLYDRQQKEMASKELSFLDSIRGEIN